MNNSESELMDRLPISDILGKEITRGGNSICYENKIDPKQIVLEIGGVWDGQPGQESLKRMLDNLHEEIKLYDQIPENVNAPKITGARVENEKLYKFMEKVSGLPVHERNCNFDQWKKSLEKLSMVSEEHYKKLVGDTKTLSKIGLQVDPSKPDNFYYNDEIGFQLIDLNKGNFDASSSLLAPIIHTYYLFTKYGDKIDQEIINYVQIIINKLVNANAAPREYSLKQINDKLNNNENN